MGMRRSVHQSQKRVDGLLVRGVFDYIYDHAFPVDDERLGDAFYPKKIKGFLFRIIEHIQVIAVFFEELVSQFSCLLLTVRMVNRKKDLPFT